MPRLKETKKEKIRRLLREGSPIDYIKSVCRTSKRFILEVKGEMK